MPAPTSPTPLRGREAELGAIGEELRAAASGHGAIVLIEGPPGIGKTRLLEQALRTARRLGVAGALGTAERIDQVTPLAPLLAALFGGDEPLLRLDGRGALPDHRFWMLQELQGRLEEAALQRPLLIALDDVQWADPATLSALRSLPARLGSHAIVWLLARRSSTAAPLPDAPAARRLLLEPLADEPVRQIAADVLGGSVEPAVLELAARAQGNPFLLVELLAGLAEEGLVRTEDGRVELLDGGRLPSRLTRSMRERLARLSAVARATIEVASVLGRRCSVHDLAAMLRRSPVELLAPLNEAIDADLLRDDRGDLAFRHDLIREAVHDALPRAVRAALHRQAADVLLAAGASPVQAAVHLDGARPGDRAAIGTLRAAARELAQSAPAVAADLSRRALALTPPDDEARGALHAETVVHLMHAGQVDAAKACADRALESALTPEHEARIRLGLAQLLSRYSESGAAAVQECRRALALPDVSAGVDANLRATLAHALLLSGRMREAREAARTALGAARAAGRRGAEAAALADLSVMEAAAHRWRPAADLIAAAVSVTDAGGGGSQPFAVPRVWQACVWAALDDLDDALDAAGAGAEQARRNGSSLTLSLWLVARSRLLYERGRLGEAQAGAEALLAAERELGVGNFAEATAWHVLARVAVGTGDRRQARAAADAVRAMLGESLVGNLARLTLGFVAAAGGDDRAAMDILAPAYDALARGEPALATPEDPTDEPWLVRFALRAGDRERAEAAALAAERRAACTPGVPSFAAAAAHARALLERDPAGLRRAVAQYRESPRRLGLAWALEDTGRELARRSRRQEAIRHLDEALRVYGDSGAAVDAARVRGRLRGLGVRRRRTAPTRPTDGWAALTASELDVVRVIATGATNRQAAERLFISPHTVSTHLRHAFAKLGIHSRVELARISAQAEPLAA